MKVQMRLPALALLLATGLGVGACASGPAMVPPPRTVVIFSGERIQADRDSMTVVDEWLRVQQEEIESNPDVSIRLQSTSEPGYPWRDFEIVGDTAIVFHQAIARDADTPYRIYAHLRLMAERDELEPWLPEDDLDATGADLEVAILNRVADVWLLGRAVYDTQAFGPLDEVMYAREGGFLREFVFATQPDRFADERDAYFEANPERRAEFVAWLERVFERSEPGYLHTEPATVDGADDDPPETGRSGAG